MYPEMCRKERLERKESTMISLLFNIVYMLIATMKVEAPCIQILHYSTDLNTSIFLDRGSTYEVIAKK